ncbi:hypothetical protein H4S07_006297, partial [Coemansia furcata]
MLAKYGFFATIALAALAQDTVLANTDLVATISASVDNASEIPATSSAPAPADISAAPAEASTIAILADTPQERMARDDDSELELKKKKKSHKKHKGE